MSTASSESEPVLATSPKTTWNPWLGLVFVAGLFFGSQLISGLLLSIYPLIKHWSNRQATDWINNSTNAQFVFILIAEAIVVAAIYLFVRRYRGGLASIGLRRPSWSDPLYGLAAVVPYFIIYLLSVGAISHLVPSLNVNQHQQLGFNNVHGSSQLLLTFISLVILPPIAEEIMVRGFLYSSLKKIMPLAWAVVMTSALFAAAHLPEGGAAGPLYIAALDTFVLSLVLIYLREKTGGLWAGMTLHAIKNSIAFIALFVLHLS